MPYIQISIHKHTGLIRIGHLTFWGRRNNTLVHLDNLIPATDYADTPERSQTVRVGILADNDLQVVVRQNPD
ncbi:hypothetical protein X801_07174, partial [Opisthorchis viverrini]